MKHVAVAWTVIHQELRFRNLVCFTKVQYERQSIPSVVDYQNVNERLQRSIEVTTKARHANEKTNLCTQVELKITVVIVFCCPGVRAIKDHLCVSVVMNFLRVRVSVLVYVSQYA